MWWKKNSEQCGMSCLGTGVVGSGLSWVGDNYQTVQHSRTGRTLKGATWSFGNARREKTRWGADSHRHWQGRGEAVKTDPAFQVRGSARHVKRRIRAVKSNQDQRDEGGGP